MSWKSVLDGNGPWKVSYRNLQWSSYSETIVLPLAILQKPTLFDRLDSNLFDVGRWCSVLTIRLDQVSATSRISHGSADVAMAHDVLRSHWVVPCLAVACEAAKKKLQIWGLQLDFSPVGRFCSRWSAASSALPLEWCAEVRRSKFSRSYVMLCRSFFLVFAVRSRPNILNFSEWGQKIPIALNEWYERHRKALWDHATTVLHHLLHWQQFEWIHAHWMIRVLHTHISLVPHEFSVVLSCRRRRLASALPWSFRISVHVPIIHDKIKMYNINPGSIWSIEILQ